MPISIKATSRRTKRVKRTLFRIDSVLSDAEIQAVAAEAVGSPQRNRPRVDDPVPGSVSFGNPFRVSWTLTYTVYGTGERGYVVTDAETVRGRVADAHEITFFLNAVEHALRRSDPSAWVLEQRNHVKARLGWLSAVRFHSLAA